VQVCRRACCSLPVSLPLRSPCGSPACSGFPTRRSRSAGRLVCSRPVVRRPAAMDARGGLRAAALLGGLHWSSYSGPLAADVVASVRTAGEVCAHSGEEPPPCCVGSPAARNPTRAQALAFASTPRNCLYSRAASRFLVTNLMTMSPFVSRRGFMRGVMASSSSSASSRAARAAVAAAWLIVLLGSATLAASDDAGPSRPVCLGFVALSATWPFGLVIFSPVLVARQNRGTQHSPRACIILLVFEHFPGWAWWRFAQPN
jgi:hypothetical protein